jgi:hypothetical protein
MIDTNQWTHARSVTEAICIMYFQGLDYSLYCDAIPCTTFTLFTFPKAKVLATHK